MCWFDWGFGPNTKVDLLRLGYTYWALALLRLTLFLFVYTVAILVKVAFVWQKLFMVLLLILLARSVDIANLCHNLLCFASASSHFVLGNQ